VQRLGVRADLRIDPAATWALVRIGQYGLEAARDVAAREGVAPAELDRVDAALRADTLLTGERLSPTGRVLADRASAARRELLQETLASGQGGKLLRELDTLLARQP
jgi:hypothetical protein